MQILHETTRHRALRLLTILQIALLSSLSAGCMTPMEALIDHHMEHETQIDGPSCPMYPSCAAYGKKAAENYPVLGFLLLIDRLFYREMGGLEHHYLPAPPEYSPHKRYYNPIEEDHPLLSEERPSLFGEDFTRP